MFTRAILLTHKITRIDQTLTRVYIDQYLHRNYLDKIHNQDLILKLNFPKIKIFMNKEKHHLGITLKWYIYNY